MPERGPPSDAARSCPSPTRAGCSTRCPPPRSSSLTTAATARKRRPRRSSRRRSPSFLAALPSPGSRAVRARASYELRVWRPGDNSTERGWGGRRTRQEGRGRIQRCAR
eukprot:5919690-Prymnesium_polylepis.1